MTTELLPGARALLEGAKTASRALARASAQLRDEALAAIAASLASQSLLTLKISLGGQPKEWQKDCRTGCA